MAVLTGIRLDRFNRQNEMRNIDAKIEGIGFLIAKNEGELENLRIPVGGIVKLQDSGKMLERTANGFVEYSGGGGSGLTTMSIAVKNTDEMKTLDVPDGTIVTVRDVWASEIIDNYSGGTESMYRISKGLKFITGDFSDTDAEIMILVGGSAEYNAILVQSSGGSVMAGFYLMSNSETPKEVHQYDAGIIDNEFLAKMNDAMKNLIQAQGYPIPYNKMDFLIDTMNMQFIKSNKGWLKLGASEYLTDRHYELVNPYSPARCKFYDKWYECTKGAVYNKDLTLETSPIIMRHNEVIGGNDMIDTVLEKLDGSVTLTYDNKNIKLVNGVEFSFENLCKLNISLDGLYYLKRGTIRFNLYPIRRDNYPLFLNANCMLDERGTSQLTTGVVDGEFIYYSPIIVRASGGSNFTLPDGTPANLHHQSSEYYAIVIDSTDGCYIARHGSDGNFTKLFEFTKKV